MSRNYLTKDDELRKGDYLMSNNREWKAVFQGDSNLVMYDSCGQPKWSTDTYVRGECKTCHLQLTDDGKLVLYRGAEEVWSSDNSKGKKE
ncbi:B-type lectin plumieribetin-like [Symphorus nematophorus]